MSSAYRQRAEAAAQAEAAEAVLVTLAESSGDEGDGGGTRVAATGGQGSLTQHRSGTWRGPH
jgi:hypothetical protein